MEKSVIIIGAGIAGLSAGCYGQMNGYRTSIFEMHDKPGGVGTSWRQHYNRERPHGALGNLAPLEYAPSVK